MTNEQQIKVFEVAGGDIKVWVDPGGSICIKTCNSHGDPVDIAEHEAIELAELLKSLVSAQRDRLRHE